MSKICVSSPISVPHAAETMSSQNEARDKSRAEISRPIKLNEPLFQDRLLADRDVAARYKVEKQTIWRWVKTSKVFPKPIKIEGTTRWSENELDEHDRKLKEAR